ncbi:MAG: ABC transporter ATP-binding protein/permease [Defluviitaleaceae bacterium]|nr:ABC transporter ATP-binding protein/permease [Defluviitaleaceae bacterium]
MTKYGVLSNAGYSLSCLWRADRVLLLWLFIGTLTRVLLPFIGIVTPRVVIDEITAAVTAERFVSVMLLLGAVLVVTHFLHGYSAAKIDPLTKNVYNADFTIRHSEKLLTMDYANREQPDFIKLNSKTQFSQHSDEGATRFIPTLSEFVVNVGGLVLFGGVIIAVHPLIILFLCASVAVNSFFQWRHRKFDEGRRQYTGEVWQKIWHTRWAMGHKPYAADIRLYSMKKWLMERWGFHLAELRVSNSKSARKGMAAGIADGFMVLIRDGGSYVFLTYLLLAGDIGLGEFVMMFAAIGGMAAWINGIITSSTNLSRSSVHMSDRRETLEYPDVLRTDGGKPRENAAEIKLVNVSYTYPGRMGEQSRESGTTSPKAEKPTLKNINLTIKPGERLAIVGVNGAGKTTLIKTICGFYTPQTGEVFYDGKKIAEYGRDDYFSAISAVFQDIYLLADTIAVNVAQSSSHDMEKVKKCMALAGLDKDPNQNLVREVNENATDLSGGERQKLALARALYKNAPLLILDEPTAALDPIAESEMYSRYAELTKGKTSIYISHRLASTRFCDRIILLDGNIISEEGTHDELIAKNGKYAEMFATQASYYKEGGDGNE